MKKVKVSIGNHGSEIRFVNNGKISVAPKGAIIKGFIAEAAVNINNSGIVSTTYKVEVKNPVDGKILKTFVTDVETDEIKSMGKVEMTCPYEEGMFQDVNSVLVKGTVLSVFNKNIFNKFEKESFSIIDEYKVYHQNMIEGVETVWGA